MTEIFSMYCVYSLPELFKLCDYAGDPVTRERMKMLLDLIWTDWAIAQINGIRGGVKTRVYQDPGTARWPGDGNGREGCTLEIPV